MTTCGGEASGTVRTADPTYGCYLSCATDDDCLSDEVCAPSGLYNEIACTRPCSRSGPVNDVSTCACACEPGSDEGVCSLHFSHRTACEGDRPVIDAQRLVIVEPTPGTLRVVGDGAVTGLRDVRYVEVVNLGNASRSTSSVVAELQAVGPSGWSFEAELAGVLADQLWLRAHHDDEGLYEAIGDLDVGKRDSSLPVQVVAADGASGGPARAPAALDCLIVTPARELDLYVEYAAEFIDQRAELTFENRCPEQVDLEVAFLRPGWGSDGPYLTLGAGETGTWSLVISSDDFDAAQIVRVGALTTSAGEAYTAVAVNVLVDYGA